ncbi:hypothetical protein H112_06901 [Trichophyton rubrum D6]|uniref:Uncharacterized protein n=3 Tax=Trichophyton TaxID=5550 RepID=A0A080WL65_TRIRC|nr:uncharacterized protein TERG_11824 [Trichophyton rubrum CBS 118892]EZF11980.1 hypothetical protein H100_06925 [Trichophyton rubrum MR850]EZF38926.1 hypothetical protein H102_06886 [Trichophyton rubrum CBS 100081]EZF49525.1 hypothetical protein H103_06909 [Trichophyton rubrum CBS 288.86]EZF60152.1 hypothetical protein H104_06864 [Trichophyton rubrum CBS 289.86]EZF70784.1 hypothetical protein H105_06925 [Trichophyton soudanense CBS 452.61]EZF81484.1 hypothetical protein H110_06905 [Trichophy
MFLEFGFPVVRAKERPPEGIVWMIKKESSTGILNDAPRLGKTVQALGPAYFAVIQRKTD